MLTTVFPRNILNPLMPDCHGRPVTGDIGRDRAVFVCGLRLCRASGEEGE